MSIPPTSEILPSILSGTAVLFLAAIAKSLLGVRREFHRFMQEHSWLIVTTLWNRDKTRKIMDHLQMPIDDNPPEDLPDVTVIRRK